MRGMLFLAPIVAGLLAVACAPAPGPAAQPAKPAAEPAKPAVVQPAKPAAAQPAKPAAQPAKPAAAEPAKPAAQPAKPAAEPAKPAAAAPQRLFVATTNTTSSYYTYHVAEAKYLGQKLPEVNLTVVETGGGADNLTRIASGELHFGLLSGTTAYQALKSVGAYKGKPPMDLRYFWIYTVGARVAMATQDSGVRKLADLNGKDFNPGLARSSTEKDFKGHMDILGIKPRYYTAGLDDAVQAIKDKRIVGLVKSQPGLTVDASTMDLMVYTKIVPLGYTDEEIKGIQAERPYDQFITVKKDEWVKGAPEFKTLSTIIGTGSNAKFPEDLAYKFTKAMVEPGAADAIGASAPFVKGWNYRQRTLEASPLPLHKGTLKYFREVGDKVPEDLIPPEAK